MPPEIELSPGTAFSCIAGREWLAIVSGVTADVLETMFFAEAVAAGCSHAWLADALSARIRFAGSHSGEMRLAISSGAADSLAAGFLGIEALELTEALRDQVLLELTNILCGALASHLWPDSKLALNSPERTDGGEATGPETLHACFELSGFELPEGLLCIWIREGESA